jgi:ribosomal protein L37AE/L43A
MALRSSTMSMPISDQSFDSQPERYHLMRKLGIVLLLVISTSLWLYILFRERRLAYPTVIQEAMAGVIIAIVAAVGSQLILSQRDAFMRIVAAMTADVAGVYLLGFVSHGKYGISQFGWLPKTMDYDGLNLIGLGLIIILFVALLFRRTKVVVIPEPLQTSAPIIEPDSLSSAPMEPSSSISISNPERPRISWSRLFTPSPPRQQRSNGRHSGLIQPAKVAPAMAPKRRRRNKARVQLALVEEHRCPYCLDTVVRSDPRGVKECPVCHTLHHKDCWDITGSCQVPHLNQ